MDVEEIVKSVVSGRAPIERVDYEGPEVIVYTPKPEYFFENPEIVAELASTLKKRIRIRSSSPRVPPEKLKDIILSLVPEEAGITSIIPVKEIGVVRVEARKPGSVVGKNGEIARKIAKETGWVVETLRAPSTESSILKGIRLYEVKHIKERQEFLRMTSLKIFRNVERPRWVRIQALGGFMEVGRSAILLETSNSRILLDFGANVGNPSDLFPYMEVLDLENLDAVIVTHAHLDHCGLIPYLYREGYSGPVYCTPPTRDLMALLQMDFVDVLVKDGREAPYSEKDIRDTVLHCITLNYGEVTDVAPDVKISLYNAGHILGSASVHIHVGKGLHNVLYTGDIKFAPTRLLSPANTRYPRVETVIIESTYGGNNDVHPSRTESEETLKRIIVETMEKGGTVLIPVFAVGRAQEILLVLESMYRENGFEWPIYIDGMIREASAIHTAYPEYMNRELREMILNDESPFESEHFVYVKNNDRASIVEEGRNIVVSPSGSLTGGPAVEYFRYMAEDERNTIVLVGYQFQGSIGRKLQRGIREIPIKENGKVRALEVRARVETLHGFSGHADRPQLERYLSRLSSPPKRIVLNHGDPKKIREFYSGLRRRFRAEVLAPKNLDAVRLV